MRLRFIYESHIFCILLLFKLLGDQCWIRKLCNKLKTKDVDRVGVVKLKDIVNNIIEKLKP